MAAVDIRTTRRGFLRRGASALAALYAPVVVPSSVFGSNAPSNRIAIGCVGLGGMGMGNLRGFLNKDGAQIVAVCDVTSSWNIEYTYDDGVRLLFSSGKSGVRFEGTEGWIQSSPFDAHPKSLLTSVIGPDDIHLYNSSDHKQDFLDCIRHRADPIAHVEIGHRSASICHLGNIAMLTGRKLRWDPGKESFVNDTEANRMLSRPMASPWRL